MKELKHFEDCLRELKAKPEVPIDRADAIMLVDGVMNRPMINNQSFPDVEMLEKLTKRMLSDSERIRKFNSHPTMKAVVNLLHFLNGAATEFISFEQEQPGDDIKVA